MIRALLCILLIAPWTSAVRAQELVITREGDTEYHRPGCAVIKDGKNVLAMQRGQAEARGLKPHKDCDPSQQSAPLPPGKPEKPIHVFVDGGKFYHREKCTKLGKPSRRMTVEEAVSQKRWPCTTCKPPLRPRPKKAASAENRATDWCRRPAGDPMPPVPRGGGPCRSAAPSI